MIRDLLTSITDFISNSRSLLRNPRENAQELLIGLAILLLILLVLIVAVSLIGAVRRSKEQRLRVRREQPHRVPQRTKLRLALLWSGVGFLVILFFLGLGYSSEPRFCNRCHVIGDYYQSWTQSTHKKVSCLACHQEPGLLGFVGKRIEALQNLELFVVGGYPETLDASVANEVCARCHKSDISETRRAEGLIVSHKELVEARYRCSDCHSGLAHENSKVAKHTSRMGICLTCHDGGEASRECSLCHYDDVDAIPKRLEHFTKADIDLEETCEECHPKQKPRPVPVAKPANFDKLCGKCHGLEVIKRSTVRGNGWRKVLVRMIKKGLVVDAHDFDAVLLYLENTYP